MNYDHKKMFYLIILGNDILHQMTSSNKYKLLVVLEDFEGDIGCAAYDSFMVGDETTYYKLTIGNYSGNAGLLNTCWVYSIFQI